MNDEVIVKNSGKWVYQKEYNTLRLNGYIDVCDSRGFFKSNWSSDTQPISGAYFPGWRSSKPVLYFHPDLTVHFKKIP